LFFFVENIVICKACILVSILGSRSELITPSLHGSLLAYLFFSDNAEKPCSLQIRRRTASKTCSKFVCSVDQSGEPGVVSQPQLECWRFGKLYRFSCLLCIDMYTISTCLYTGIIHGGDVITIAVLLLLILLVSLLARLKF